MYNAKNYAKHFKSAVEVFSCGLEVDCRTIKTEVELRVRDLNSSLFIHVVPAMCVHKIK